MPELTYLRISLDTLGSLLLRLTSACTVLRLQGLLLLLFNLAGVLSFRVVLPGLLEDVQDPIVLLHGLQSLGLADIGADELGITLEGIITVLHSLRESHELNKSSSTVGETTGVVRSALCHFCEGINCTRPVSFLELLLAQFAGLLSLGRVNVCITLGLDLGLLGIAELRKDIRCAVLGE